MTKDRDEYRENRLSSWDVSLKHQSPDIVPCVVHDEGFVRKLWKENIAHEITGDAIVSMEELEESILIQDILLDRKKHKNGK